MADVFSIEFLDCRLVVPEKFFVYESMDEACFPDASRAQDDNLRTKITVVMNGYKKETTSAA